MIEEECNSALKTLYVFSTSFYSRLTQNGYEGVQNWTFNLDESQKSFGALLHKKPFELEVRVTSITLARELS